MNPIIKEITASQVKKDITPFKVGDGVRVHTKVREGDKERVQVYAGIVIATRTTDVFGRLLASGIVAWFGLQTLVNLGAVTGLLPVTGVPLPFLSYGGSSLVVSLAAVGVLVSVARAPIRAGSGPAATRRGRAASEDAGGGRAR